MSYMCVTDKEIIGVHRLIAGGYYYVSSLQFSLHEKSRQNLK